MPISNDTFSTCEETCEMKNPTKVRSMSGSLYDVVCKIDGGHRSTQRMLFLRYVKSGATAGALVVSNEGPVDLVKCE